ncbi:MAG TPA: circadian clock KaiB family protein [Candidatus Nanopelagicales bacterium]|nr:circadian clock KaiB family protein [Candidatus Nanopelagicales bacterium]
MGKYVFKLFVTGQTPRSEQAIRNLRAMCEARLPGRYEMVVIDVLDQPELAEAQRVLATPMLIKETPPPERRIIGELTQVDDVLRLLGLQAPRGLRGAEGEDP